MKPLLNSEVHKERVVAACYPINAKNHLVPKAYNCVWEHLLPKSLRSAGPGKQIIKLTLP